MWLLLQYWLVKSAQEISLSLHLFSFSLYGIFKNILPFSTSATVTDVKWGSYCIDQLPLWQINLTVYYKRRCVSGGIVFEVLSHLSALVFTKKLLFLHQMYARHLIILCSVFSLSQQVVSWNIFIHLCSRKMGIA